MRFALGLATFACLAFSGSAVSLQSMDMDEDMAKLADTINGMMEEMESLKARNRNNQMALNQLYGQQDGDADKKDEAKKSDPPKAEPKKDEPKTQDPPKVEPKKPDPPKVEPKTEEAKKPDTPKVEPKKDEPKKPEPPKVVPKKPEPPKVVPKKPEPPKTETKKEEEKKEEPKKPADSPKAITEPPLPPKQPPTTPPKPPAKPLAKPAEKPTDKPTDTKPPMLGTTPPTPKLDIKKETPTTDPSQMIHLAFDPHTGSIRIMGGPVPGGEESTQMDPKK